MEFLNAYQPKTQLIKIPNSLDSSRPYKRLLQNLNTWGYRELFLPKNYFKTCSKVNSRNRLKKEILWFLELYFIWSAPRYITWVSCCWSVTRRKKAFLTFQNNKKSIAAAQECKNTLLQTVLKDFWSAFRPYWRKCKNGDS